MLRLFNGPWRHPRIHVAAVAAVAARAFTATASASSKALPPRPKPPPESEIEESFIRGTGPGGQKINKSSIAVQLKHIPTGIIVNCQETRSREQNRKYARQRLARKVDDHFNGDQSRSEIVKEINKKKSASASKKSRRKYRKLEAEKAIEGAEGTAAEPDAETPPIVEVTEDNGPHNQRP